MKMWIRWDAQSILGIIFYLTSYLKVAQETNKMKGLTMEWLQTNIQYVVNIKNIQ